MTSSFHAEAALLYDRTADKEDTKPPIPVFILQQKRVSSELTDPFSVSVCRAYSTAESSALNSSTIVTTVSFMVSLVVAQSVPCMEALIPSVSA